MTSKLFWSRGEMVLATLGLIFCWWLIPLNEAHRAVKRRWEKPIIVPPPLPTRWRRRLTGSSGQRPKTMGLFPKSDSGRPTAQSQSISSSPFFKLSPEIRVMIYRELLSNHFIHICRTPGKSRKKPARMAHLKCDGMSSYYPLPWHCTCDVGNFRNNRHIPPGRQGQFLALTRTCRQIYNETIDLLYSSNTFDVCNDDIALLFFSTILPQRIHAIQSLWIYQDAKDECADSKKSKLWSTISQMQGLRRLEIVVTSSTPLAKDGVVLRHFNEMKKREVGQYILHSYEGYNSNEYVEM